MKWILTALLPVIWWGSAHGQEAAPAPAPERRPVKIQVYHADPWFIKAMIEGQKLVSPELSTIINFMGLPAATGQAIDHAFDDGVLVVNPTDNSLWFFPSKKG